jgi:hypothetical protein
MSDFSNYSVEIIPHKLADDFLKRHHYLAQQGNGFLSKENYGLFKIGGGLIGVITFSGISVVETLIGAFENFDRQSNQDGFYELSRLAMDDERKVKNLTSWFLSRAIKQLRKNNDVRALISYADSKYHHGYIYQATNFKYYGLSSQKSDFFYVDENGKEKQLWRGKTSDYVGEWRQRSRKHRYMLVYDKSLKVKWNEQPYPKGNNTEYKLITEIIGQTYLYDFI